MSDDDTDIEEPSASGAAPGRTVPAGAFVAAVLVAGVLGILAIVALSSGSGGNDASTEDARFAAGRFAERFLTFEHDALDDWKAGVLSLSTGGFTSEVENVEEGLRRLIGESELDASTQVTEIFVGDIDSGTVSVVLTYDRDVTGASGTRSETDRYMQLEMNQVDGEWLVDNVIDISTAGGLDEQPAASPESSDPTATTSTTSGG
ncbi:hypothetical protein [Actinospongicola halichondriae]|uniref:hypothetical protein n=1 Tax=Actinospongicola halichondriae TaxID=3236844 RepID=UPI003D52BFFA